MGTTLGTQGQAGEVHGDNPGDSVGDMKMSVGPSENIHGDKLGDTGAARGHPWGHKEGLRVSMGTASGTQGWPWGHGDILRDTEMVFGDMVAMGTWG